MLWQKFPMQRHAIWSRKTFEMKDKPIICTRGFHFCEYPLDVFSYYIPNATNKYALVEASGDIDREIVGNEKACTNKLYIKEELTLSDMLDHAILYIKNKSLTNNCCVVDTRDERANSALSLDAMSLAIAPSSRFLYNSIAGNIGSRSIAKNDQKVHFS